MKRIIGPPLRGWDLPRMVDRLRSMEAPELFCTDMAIPLWKESIRYGIDPVGPIAQSAKETNWGKFTGVVKAEWRNTAGIKVRFQNLHPELSGDKPLAHAMFPSWEVGARAHVQHVCAYAGQPVDDLIIDPRWDFVVGKYNLQVWDDFRKLWGPDDNYGLSVEVIMKKILEEA